MQAQHLFIHLFFWLWRIPHRSSWKFSPLRMHSTLHLFLAPILQRRGSQPQLHIGITQVWEIPSLDPTPRDFDVMGWRAAWDTPTCNQGWEPRPAKDYPTWAPSTDFHLRPQFSLSLVLCSFLPGLEDDMYLPLLRPLLVKVASPYTLSYPNPPLPPCSSSRAALQPRFHRVLNQIRKTEKYIYPSGYHMTFFPLNYCN